MGGRKAWQLVGRVLRRGSLSVAAFWAGAAARAVERGGFLGGCCGTLGGKNIGKCRLRAHQHPPSPPLSILLEPAPCNIQGKTRLQRVMERVLGDVLKMGCFVHRFLISCPDLRIDARFSPETAQRLHRFLISCPDLRIDAGFSPETAQSVLRSLISGPDLRIDAAICLETHLALQ